MSDKNLFWEVTILKNPEDRYFWTAEATDPKCGCPRLLHMDGDVTTKSSATRNWVTYADKNGIAGAKWALKKLRKSIKEN